MSILVFSDGEKFDTSGELRAEERTDGWYVIGEGNLIPVSNEAEAQELITKLKPNDESSVLNK
jgi:hypothetical protein